MNKTPYTDPQAMHLLAVHASPFETAESGVLHLRLEKILNFYAVFTGIVGSNASVHFYTLVLFPVKSLNTLQGN